jgi:transcriptional regulator with XRE-family HTH domain
MEQSVPLMEKKMASPKQQSIELSTSEFGKLVRTYRIQRRLSQQQLADKWGHSREYISQIERGMRKLDRVDQVNRLADILEIPPERLDAIGKGIPQRKMAAEHTSEADDVLLQALLEPAQATVKLSWLVWHGDGDTTIINNLNSLVVNLEDALTQYRGTFRRPTQQLLAYAYEMMGKISFDQLNYVEANGRFDEMYQLGQELDDSNIIALAMTHQGDILRKRGRYELAVRCLEVAQPYAETSDPYIRGMRWQILARAHYEYGYESSFLRAIDHAQEIALQTQSTLDAKYNQFNLIEVLQERAQGYTMLWQPQKALDIYKETDQLKPFRPLRDLGSYTIIKAQAHAFSGDIDEGVKLALKGLDIARGYGSKRHIARVQKMYDRLSTTPMSQHDLLRDLRDALMHV